MVGSSRENPRRRTGETTSLFGLVNFQPRLAIVLIFLTLTIVVVGVRIARDSGIRRVDSLVRQAQRAFSTPGKGEETARDPAEVEMRVKEWTGAAIHLPRDEQRFSYTGVEREKTGRQVTAAIRFSFSGEPYLLLVVRKEMIGNSGSLFPQSGFLSGEKEGKSFVFWEREGVSYLLVTGAELERAFDLVRRYFT